MTATTVSTASGTGLSAGRATARQVAPAGPEHLTPAGATEVDRSAQLRLVPPVRVAAPRGPYVLLVATLLVLGLGGLLLLNTVVAQDAFQLHSLQVEANQLTTQQQTLQRQVDELSTPSALAGEARRLGMVPLQAPAFLRLSDGAVLGRPAVATAAPVPAGAPRTATTPASGAATPAAGPGQPAGAAAPAATTPVTDTGVPATTTGTAATGTAAAPATARTR